MVKVKTKAKTKTKKKIMYAAGISAILLAGLKASRMLLKNKNTKPSNSPSSNKNTGPQNSPDGSGIPQEIEVVKSSVKTPVTKQRKTYYYIEPKNNGKSNIKQRVYKYV